jgi:hypothetical protein
MHVVVLGHDTPIGAAPPSNERGGTAPASIDHLVPFQCSIALPTAEQLVGFAHDTELKPPALGIVTMDQLTPFQCSINAFDALREAASPTAQQLVVLGHDTPLKVLTKYGLGLGTIDGDVVPFQCSTNVRAPASGVSW